MSSTAVDPVHGGETDRWGGWSWREPSRGEHFRTCTYCGSISPDDLAAEPDWQAEWADRKYGWPHKFYVSVPNRNPAQRFIIGATTGSPTSLAVGEWVRADEIPADVNVEGWEDARSSYQWFSIGTRPQHHAKFYTVHLADPMLGDGIRDRVQTVSGLQFTFEEGRVSWAPSPQGERTG